MRVLKFCLPLLLTVTVPLTAQSSFEQLIEENRFAEAEALGRRALAALGDTDTPALADALQQVATALVRQHRHIDAQPLIERALRIREAHDGDDAADTAALLNLLTSVYDEGHYDFPLMRQTAERALQVASVLDENHPVRFEARRLRGFADARNRAPDAGAVALRALLADEERVLPPNSPLIGNVLQSLSLTITQLGQVAEAATLASRSLAIRSAAGDALLAGHSANNLAGLLTDLGDYVEAKRVFEVAIDFRLKSVGATHRLMGRTQYLLAQFLAELGDQQASAETYETALSNLGGAVDVTNAMMRYATSLSDWGRLEEATRMFQRALRYENGHPGPLLDRMLRTRYVSHLRRLGQFEAALRTGKDLDHPVLPGVLPALLRADMGDLDGAVPMLRRALADMPASTFSNQPVTSVRSEAASYLARAGQADAVPLALDLADRSFEIQQLAVGGMSERESLIYATHHRDSIDLLIAMTAHTYRDPRFVAQVFERIVQGRAVVLDETARRQRRAETPEIARRQAELQQARERLSRVLVRRESALSADAQRLLRVDAQTAVDRAESALADVSSAFRASQSEHRVRGADVVSAVDHGQALLAYARYRDRIGAHDEHYGAFVVRGHPASIRFVPLGPAQPIDAAVAATRADLLLQARAPGRANRRLIAAYRTSGAALRKLIWDPLQPEMGDGIDRTYIVADGALHLVSFAALPVGRDEYLVDRGPTLHYLAAERELITPPRTPAPNGLLAIGDPRFDETRRFSALAPKAAAAPVGLRSGGNCNQFQGLTFGALPGSAAEAQSVVALWQQRGGASALLLGASQADEATVKARAGEFKVLHFATHGFVFGEECHSLLSGLALAGANHRSAAADLEDDGVLTAGEITGLNLGGVEWAVLSACDTGLGSIATGEGVLGLQRAFRVAGAATVIMSLWPVDDDATRAWMQELYRARLIDRHNTADATRSAMQTTLAQRRQSGQSTHPFYWAGFVASGDWR